MAVRRFHSNSSQILILQSFLIWPSVCLILDVSWINHRKFRQSKQTKLWYYVYSKQKKIAPAKENIIYRINSFTNVLDAIYNLSLNKILYYLCYIATCILHISLEWTYNDQAVFNKNVPNMKRGFYLTFGRFVYQTFRSTKFSLPNIPQHKADTNYPFTPSTPDPNKNRAIHNLLNGVEKFPCTTLWRPILPCCHFQKELRVGPSILWITPRRSFIYITIFVTSRQTY